MYFEKGLNYAEIERNTGHNYRTIKKYIEVENFNLNQSKESSSPKSDLIRPYIQEILKSDKVGYFRSNLFVPEPVVDDLAKYNLSLLTLCAKNNQRPHYEKVGSTIKALFQLDIPLMGKTAKVPFDYEKLEPRRVNKQGYITNDGCYYSSHLNT